jgi:predicted RecB family nuclease
VSIPPKITNEALEAYCYCAQKFYLKLQGARGTKTDYELMRDQSRSRTRSNAIRRFARGPGSGTVMQLTQTTLQNAPQYIFDGIYEDQNFALHIDGVRKVAHTSDPREYSFHPILFSGSLRTDKQHKTILRAYGYALSTILAKQVLVGFVWNAHDCTTRVHLGLDRRNFSNWIDRLLAARRSASPPPLFLNDHCSICEFQERCRQQALDEGNLSLLKGMTLNEIAKYNSKGLFTVHQVSYTFRARRKPKRARGVTGPHYFSLQAQALRENKIFIHGSVNFTVGAPRVYFDIEGTPESRVDYLIGALTIDHGKEEFVSFWARRDEEQSQIFAEFLRYLSNLSEYHLLHFGSYEISALRRAKSFLPCELHSSLDEAISRCTNVLSTIRTRVYFPTYSNSLKEIGGFLGATWSVPSPSAIQTLVWRERWLQTKNQIWKKQLLKYNRDDCYALRRVVEFLDDLVSKQDMPRQGLNDQSLIFTDTLPKGERKGQIFRKKGFAIKEFERINRCAYFDYQRDRVSARSGTRTQRNRKETKRRSWKLRLNKAIHVVLKRCPSCRSRQVRPMRAISRTVIDLKVSTQGVKRWVVRYLTNEYACKKCGAVIIPAGVPPVGSKFGWSLAAWCIYNHVVAGQNLSRVAAGLGHLFRLSVPLPTVHRFKEYVSNHYRGYCKELFANLMTSPYLHIDETTVQLHSSTGYVWIVANRDTAYYFYRPSREGSFLQQLLSGFHGVLISDFFTAYDSLELRQQRCLIHLLRDFNEELLKAPYDDQLRLFGDNFSSILSRVVNTIDDHGLKRRYLSRHKRDAANFLRWVAEAKFESRPASKLQTRIMKYEKMLFTFLDFDDVSWHNNNAERAIKTFARYRRFADGRFTADSIERHLTILSVYQTCEFRGIGFLDFMLGRTKRGAGPDVPWVLNSSISGAGADPESLPGFNPTDLEVQL